MKAEYVTKIVLFYDNSIPGVGPWWVNEEIIYETAAANMTIVVPKGFPTDLTTVPKIPLIYETFSDEAIKAAIIHDYLYVSKIVSRKLADQIFDEAAHASNVPAWKRKIMYIVLRNFGWYYYK